MFGLTFNQELEPGIIPDYVTHVKFGYHFNKPLAEGHIPNGVTHLIFNHQLKAGDLPNSLKHITFGKYYDYVLSHNCISPNLETITCMDRNTPINLSNIPLYIDIYLHPNYMYDYDKPISLTNVRHQVYVKSGGFDVDIMKNKVAGVFYITTVITSDNNKYLLVRGGDYVLPMSY